MSDEWLAKDEIKVEVDSLKDFADHIKAELEQNFRPSYEAGILPMLTVQAPFGGTAEMKEGALFRNRHANSVTAARELLSEVMRGMLALATAAMSIQAEYLMGDAFSQAQSDQVLNAFSGVDGQKMLSDYWNQPAEGADQSTDSGTVTAAQQDPNNYDFGDGGGQPDDGDGGTMYDPKDIGDPDDPGYYHIAGDDENMHDDRYDLPSYMEK